MHVVFIGASGTGKTHWGRELARLTGLPFADLDGLVEAALATSIPELFANGRTAEFRTMEAALLVEILKSEVPGILSTGGGAPLHAGSYKRIQQSGAHIVALDPPLEELLRRLDPVWQERPLLAAEGSSGWRIKAEQLHTERALIYRELAHEVWCSHEREACFDLARRLIEAQSK